MAAAARSALLAPVGLCCLLLILFLIASTIILALIPVYLPVRRVNVGANPQQMALSVGYASDAVGTRSDPLANIDGLLPQLLGGSGPPNGAVDLNGANFISETAVARRKRQTINSNGTITCEKPTGLTGDIFVADYTITFPRRCIGSCRNRFRMNVINALRRNDERFTVTMNFVTAGRKQVILVFCGFFGSGSLDCTPETRTNAYFIDRDDILYQFNPISFAVTNLGVVNCSTSSSLYSIALQRNGVLWTSFEDGSLFRYNIGSRQCTPTGFVANQSNFTTYTITFLKSASDTSETLYASEQIGSGARLARIDTNNFTLSIVGTYNNRLDTFADLAGVNDGRLFGVFDAKPYTIAQIDPTNANVLAQYPLNRSSQTDDPNYGFTVFNRRFFFFEGNNTPSDLLTFDLPTNTTTFQRTIPQIVFGATSSSCLGT